MPPPPPPKPAQRTPLNIDDVAIDFSAVKSSSAGAGGAASTAGAATAAASFASTAGPAVIPGLLELMQQQQQDENTNSSSNGRQKVSDVRAFDPSLQGVAQRPLQNLAGGAGGRRKKIFGGQPYVPPPSVSGPVEQPASGTVKKSGGFELDKPVANEDRGVDGGTSSSTDGNVDAGQDALDFLLQTQQKQLQRTSASDLQLRREAYTRELRSFCQRGRPHCTVPEEKRKPMTDVNVTAAPAATHASPTGAHASEAQQPFPNTATTHTNSLLKQFFADGVPDIEPWDRWTSAMPRYGEAKHLLVNPLSATPKQIHDAKLDLVHHPVIPDTHYTRHYQYRELAQPVLPKEYKSKDELRAERRERLKEKQAKKQQERAAAASAVVNLQEGSANANASSLSAPSTTSAAGRLLHDRLSTKNLALNLFASSVLNPLAADTKVLQQYELRNLEHQRRNHDRHVAALPNQILKRERDQQRYAVEHPLLRAYRVFPIFAPAHLGKLRHYANDNLLRGFVLFIAECDALIVLAGGEKAMRHLDHWILQKMSWEHPDTRATRLVTVPLMDAASFSFHLPKAGQAANGSGAGRVYKQGKLVESASVKVSFAADAMASGDAAVEKEPVFINMVTSVEEGEKFLRQLPAPPSPWGDLTAIWRTAFLQDGLQDQ